MLFSDMESTYKSDLPLSSAVLAALNDGLAERWKWSYIESQLLSKIHAGRNGDLGTSFDEFERWYHFDYGSFAGIPRSPSHFLNLPKVPAGCKSVFQLCPLVDTLGGCSDPKGKRAG